MRLFVAIELPESWRVEAAALRGRLIERLGDDAALRFTSPERLHLTLRFLGEVEEATAAALQAKLEQALSPTEVGLDLGVVGTFGSRSRPRVVWLGPTGDLDGLRALRDEIDAAATSAELEVDERPLRAHITLARVDRRATATQGRAITAAVAQLEGPGSSPFVARDVVLVRSHLGARARYEVLGRYPAGVI